MNSPDNNLLKIESNNYHSNLTNSPTGNNLIINVIETPTSSFHNENIHLINENDINEINNNQINNLNQTSTFPINNESHMNSNFSSLVSQQHIISKLNSLNEQISFKQEGLKYTLLYNDTNLKTNNCSRQNSMNVIEHKNTTKSNLSKNLLNLETIPLYTQQLHLKLFNDFIQKKNPVIYSEKTINEKIFGFAAFTFDNNNDTKTKITVNINLSTKEENSINYFSLYNKTLHKEILSNLITLNTEEQIQIIQKIDDDIFMVKSQNDYITILSNIDSNDINQNYISILSLNDSTNVKILSNQQKISYKDNLDFIIIMNKGVFKNVYCIEINYMIYDILKSIILNAQSFDEFLNKIIIYIFEQCIVNGGKNEMSIIFVCLKNIRNLFDSKDINRIDKILLRLEKTTYEVDYKNMKYFRNCTVNETNSPQTVKKNFNITFKKTLSKGELELITKKHKKNVSIFKCCGI